MFLIDKSCSKTISSSIKTPIPSKYFLLCIFKQWSKS